MDNMKDLFEKNCFPMDWSEDNAILDEIDDAREFVQARTKLEELVPQHKDLTTLLAELEDIKNNIEDINSREWLLTKLVKFYNEGFQLD